MPLSRLPFWLATVNPNKVKAAIRERVVLFQEQAADVLAAAFLSNGTRQDAAMAKRVAGTVMCRILHDTLVGLGRDPRTVAFVKQANIANGHQQVNNGPESPGQASERSGQARPRGRENEQNVLLEEKANGQWLEPRTSPATGAGNPDLASVGALDRTKDQGR